MCHLTEQETRVVMVVVMMAMMVLMGESGMFLMISDDVVTRLAGCWWCSQLNMQSPICLLIILNITAQERRGDPPWTCWTDSRLTADDGEFQCVLPSDTQ